MSSLDGLLDRLVRDEVRQFDIKDKLTIHLVKKERRGTYQAFQESGGTEQEIMDNTVQYIKEWMQSELLDGKISKLLKAEIKSQTILELSSKGFLGVLP